MGRKTSVYLADDLDDAVKASGVPLGELVRRGLEARSPEEATAKAAAEAVRDDVVTAGAALANGAVAGAHDDMYASVEEMLDRVVKRALRDAQGGAW